MEAYINGIGCVSPQNTLDNNCFLDEVVEHNSDFLQCVAPDYKQFLDPKLARRMGRVIKMGVASAKIALRQANLENPDAIITGTGLGCIQDTEKFLTSVIENDEKLLTPTSFIQSTHNTIGGQIALMLGCNHYNMAYVHSGSSFETAMIDALMLLAENEAGNILLGGVDEITQHRFEVIKRLDYLKDESINNLDLLKSDSKGTIGGEGAVFFALSKVRSEKSVGKIQSVSTFYKPNSSNEVEKQISDFLGNNSVDLVVLGNSGDNRTDYFFNDLQKSIFANIPQVGFKHLCGEYFSSSAFALWLTTQILNKQTVPEITCLNDIAVSEIKNILIYNHYRGVNHSLMLVSIC
ncbi:beta-ketoacyl synthase chain length factor [Bacteroidales bacterium AH-315-I05]|nr:beta-ketoacyl synthase chain length factor [Bacteroidales bacterium AH-315-I05]